ncbi:carbonic anhydrase [Apibacter mensalis]|uniref:Carbonic anhydrase 2 n=1 Tax=Apibacter mensalis TaxID=1586267 RepID=A0A0X3AN13_9FLAO|nr:carbonic anhydrase [Apibacter mensalis]CVK15771.1 carbonic anhydrase [Apibacter mensalis]
MNFEKIFAHNDIWIAEKLSVDKEYFNKLSEGQNPEVLYIGCSDSRVATEELLGAKPGEVFVHRNLANMVISTDFNVQSVITYAIEHLKVKQIIVCGHYYCGGVKEAMEAKDLGLLNPWLRNIRDVYRIHKDELNLIKNSEEKYNRLIELNVEEQCINLIKTAAVQKAIIESNLKVHGWIFDIRSGKLIDMKINFKKILKEIMEIYNLYEGKSLF